MMAATRWCIDRFTVVDGVAMAVGWSDRDAPKIYIGDSLAKNQTAARYFRPDLIPILGSEAAKTCGFRVAAAISERPRNDQVYARFKNGTTAYEAAGPIDTRISDVLDAFTKSIAAKPGSSLIEIGSRARSGNSYRNLFPTVGEYLGIDIAEGPNVDLIADAHTLSRSVSQKFDFAFSVSVYEHLVMPWVAAYELNKVLNIGGLAYIQSHPAWPLHEEPWDFFRFSKDAWGGLFNALTGFEMVDAAYGIEATIVPSSKAGGSLQGIDTERTFLLSACLARKVADPIVDWSADPSRIFNLKYDH